VGLALPQEKRRVGLRTLPLEVYVFLEYGPERVIADEKRRKRK
jgi:hypothetical protein